MAAKKLAAVFSDRPTLDQALATLQQAGFDTEEVSLLLKQSQADHNFAQEDHFIERTVAEPLTVGTVVATPEASDSSAVPVSAVYDPVAMSIDALPEAHAMTLQSVPDDATGTQIPAVVARPGIPIEPVLDTSVRVSPPEAALKDPHALVTDTTIGGLLGILAGTAILMIPGLGPVLAVGPIAGGLAMLTGTAALGASLGAVAGLLSDEGIPSNRVEFYRDAFDAGQGIILLAPKDPSMLGTGYNMLQALGPDSIEELDV